MQLITLLMHVNLFAFRRLSALIKAPQLPFFPPPILDAFESGNVR